MELFVNLLAAHLIGDFYLQTDRTCRDKEQKGFRSLHLYLHTILILALTYAFANAYTSFANYALVVAASHLLIDGAKSFFHRHPLATFCIDQVLHIAILGVVTHYYIEANGSWEQFEWLRSADLRALPAMVCAGAVCCKPANLIIKLVLEQYKINVPKTSGKELNNAGSLIGNLERLICLCLVVAGQFEAVGFLIAAKSILRFKDHETAKTEYVLVGTLLSFGIAITLGLLLNAYRA